MGNEKKNNKGPNKIIALITYIIALACLLLGLFLPSNFEDATGSMLFMQLPAAFDSVYMIGDNGLQGILNWPDFTYNFPFSVFGWPEGGINLAAILLLLYALVTVIGVLLLIPMIISTCKGRKKKGKKGGKSNKASAPVSDPMADEFGAANAPAPAPAKSKKNFVLGAASFVEVLSLLFLTSFLLVYMNGVVTEGKELMDLIANYGFTAAFGGTLVMLVVQSLIYKGGSGLMKIILAVLSLAGVMLVYGVTFFLPFLAEIEFMQNIELSLYSVDGEAVTVLPLINALFAGELIVEGQDMMLTILNVSAVAMGFLVCINFVLDVMGLGKKTNKGMLVCNIIRYLLELVAAVMVLVLAIVIEGYTFGYLSIVIGILALAALVLNILRCIAYVKKKNKAKGKAKSKKGAKAPKEAKAKPEKATAVATAEAVAAEKPAKEEKVKPEKPRKETRKERKARLAEEKRQQKEAEKQRKLEAKQAKSAKPETVEPAVEAATEKSGQYSPLLYKGPIDSFIKTLPNEQRIEFAQVFIEHREATVISCLPEYDVGGKNEKFFTSIFIYYSRIRDLISDELMDRLYKQAKVM